MRHLPGQVLALEITDAVLDEHGEPFMPRQKGAAIWQFPGNQTRATCMTLCQDMGLPAIVELDDNYLVPPPPLPWMKGTNRPWQIKQSPANVDLHSHQMHRKIVRDVADALIVSTPTLANQYADATDAPIFVCPNSADLADWPKPLEKDGVFRIGYAGSESHRFDITIVDRALDSASRSGVDLVKLGVGSYEWRWPHTQVPWADDLAEYRNNLINARMTIGLCPLRRSNWADCKSDVKAIEYTLAGALPVIQADSPCYSDWLEIVPSASTEKQWEKVVRHLIQNPDEVHENWERAYRFVLDNKTIDKTIHLWKEACS